MGAFRPRVLLVGCGNIAGGFDMVRPIDAWPVSQAGAFRRHGGFELLGCVDPQDVVRKAFATYWRIPNHASDIESLNACPGDFDVISICSPTACHHVHIEAALKLSPKLIFCEKPLTHSLELTKEWVQTCASEGVHLVVNYTRQWDPIVGRLVHDLRHGVWGRVRSVTGFYNKGVLNNGGHLIDLLLRILGSLRVVAATAPIYDYWDDDPTLAALLVSESDQVPITLNPAHAKDYALFEVEFVCEYGVIRMRNGGLKWDILHAEVSPLFNNYRALSESQTSDGGYMQAMTLAVTEIYDFLNQGHDIRSTGNSAMAVQLICDQLLAVALASATPTI